MMPNNGDNRITPQDVVNFLVAIGKNAAELKGDWDFWSDNNRTLSTSDIFAPSYRLGATKERYKNEIAIYNAILTARDFVSPLPQSQMWQTSQYQQLFNPYYNPTLVEYNKHRNALAWHTENIPIYVAIRYGKEGVDWILSKFGEEVKRCYYGG